MAEGFWQLSHEHLAAVLARTDLSWETARVLLALADLTIGYGKAKDVVSLGQIAKRADMERTHVPRCLERLESVGLYGQQVLKPQKVIRWVTWPIPSVTDIGTSTNAGNGSVTEAGIETVTKGVTGVGTHQNTKKKEKKTYVAFYQFWNSKCSLPTIQSMTPERKKQLDTRMREKLFADNWRVIIDKLSASPFCTGDNGSGWEATVDWLLKNATNYVKVLEGKYDSSSSPQALASIPVVRDAEGLTPRERLIKERGISI